MKRALVLLCFALSFAASTAHAIFTEVGASYSRKRTTFDASNYVDQESYTGSVSLYFRESIALELSYTQALGVREELTPVSHQTIVQTTKVYGADLIYVFAGRKEFFQPYIKGGVANVERRQEVKNYNLNDRVDSIEPEVAIIPSYGVGFKLQFTDAFGVKVSYDGWKTPIGGGAFSNDDAVRAGVSWFL